MRLSEIWIEISLQPDCHRMAQRGNRYVLPWCWPSGSLVITICSIGNCWKNYILRAKKNPVWMTRFIFSSNTVGSRVQEQGAACIDSQSNFSTIDGAVNIRQPHCWLIMAWLVGLSAALRVKVTNSPDRKRVEPSGLPPLKGCCMYRLALIRAVRELQGHKRRVALS